MTNTDTADADMQAFYDREFGGIPESVWRPIWDTYITDVMQVFDDVRDAHDIAVRTYSDEILAAAEKGVNAERYRRLARVKWEKAGERIEYAKRSRMRVAQEKMTRSLEQARREAQR